MQFSREMVSNVRGMDLAETIDQVVELAAITASAKHIEINVDGPKRMPISGDPILLGQTIMNLVLNAIEAMHPSTSLTAGDPGTVTVRYAPPPAESDAKQFHLIVRDSGPGIPAHILDRIFNPFFTTKDSGTGLGLAIVHRAVEAHNGTIHASNADGGGAKFEIRI